MHWDLSGKHVVGKYLGAYAISGIVKESRVKYGGTIQHTVQLNSPISVYGAVRDTILVETHDIQVCDR